MDPAALFAGVLTGEHSLAELTALRDHIAISWYTRAAQAYRGDVLLALIELRPLDEEIIYNLRLLPLDGDRVVLNEQLLRALLPSYPPGMQVNLTAYAQAQGTAVPTPITVAQAYELANVLIPRKITGGWAAPAVTGTETMHGLIRVLALHLGPDRVSCRSGPMLRGTPSQTRRLLSYNFLSLKYLSGQQVQNLWRDYPWLLARRASKQWLKSQLGRPASNYDGTCSPSDARWSRFSERTWPGTSGPASDLSRMRYGHHCSMRDTYFHHT